MRQLFETFPSVFDILRLAAGDSSRAFSDSADAA